MFQPKFTYTHNVVTLLTKIAVSREAILDSPLIPKWEVGLRKEAMIRSAHSSTSIEGNKLALEDVSQLAHGRTVMGTRKDKQEVLNYMNVLEKLESFIKSDELTERSLLNIHKRLTTETMISNMISDMIMFLQNNELAANA